MVERENQSFDLCCGMPYPSKQINKCNLEDCKLFIDEIYYRKIFFYMLLLLLLLFETESFFVAPTILKLSV